MWNKRVIVICVVVIALITLTTKMLTSYLYEGFIFEDTVQAGANGKVCFYTVQIDSKLDVDNFTDKTPKMGISLDWADKQNAIVNVNVYEVVDKKEILIEKWREKEGLQCGVLNVKPGQKFKLEVLAAKGATSFTLKLFKPSDAYSSADSDHVNSIGNLVFYRINESRANTIYTYGSHLLSIDSNYEHERVYVFTGNEDKFMENYNINDTIELKEIGIDNLIVLQKDYTPFPQFLSVDNYYAINDKNGRIEPVAVAGKFTDPISINCGETYIFQKVRFEEKSKYLLLLCPENEGVDLQISLYSENDIEYSNCIRKSSRLKTNCNILLLNDLDKNIEYQLLITAHSMKKKSTSFIVTLMGNGELKKLDLEFNSVESIPLKLINNNGTEILWYVFKPKDIGQHEVLLSWYGEMGLAPQNTLAFNTKAILFENGVGIRSKESSGTIGSINLTFESINPDTTYFLKVIKNSSGAHSLETKGLLPTSVSVMGNSTYNEGMFDLLLNLLVTGDMEIEYFANWYQLMFGLQGIKYKLIGVLVDKVTNGDITPSALLAEYNRLNTLTDWSMKSVIEQLGLMHQSNLLTVEEYVKSYRSILNSKEDIQKILESNVLFKYERGNIDWVTFKEWSDKYVLVDFSAYNQHVSEILEYMLQNSLLTWSQFEKIEFIAESKHSVEMALKLLMSKVLDLDSFKNMCLRELQNLPEWFENLCDWGTDLKANAQILTESNIDEMFKEKKDSELSNVQNFLKLLNFYRDDVDGQMGEKSKNALKEFKSFYNYYYSGADFEINYSLDYNVVLTMILVYVDQIKILKADQLPYWYKNLYDWRNNINAELEGPIAFSLNENNARIWCLETAFNRLDGDISINGKYDEDLRDAIIAYKETNNTDQIDAQLLTKLLDESYEKAVIDMIDAKRVRQYGTFTWPVDSHNITSGFGFRLHPVKNVWEGHSGVDIGAVIPGVDGDKVYPILEGVVKSAKNSLGDSGTGTMVEIEHDSRVKSRYLHFRHKSINHLVIGNEVDESDYIGLMGETGWADGVHLHLDIKFFDGFEYRYVDPILFFDFSTLH